MPASEADESMADSSMPAAEDEYLIGYTSTDMTDPFVIANNVGVFAAAMDLGAQLIVADAANDVGTQLADMENMVTQGVQAIIITASDTNSADAYHAITQAAGIPLIAMNRDIGESCEGWVGADSTEAAAEMAQIIIDEIGGSGNVAHLEGILGQTTNNDRTNAVLGVLEENPDVVRVRTEAADWNRTNALEKVETWIQAGETINGVIANSDEMAMGAMIAFENAGMLDGVAIGGIDGSRVVIDEVKAGTITVTMSTSTFDMGYESVVMAIDYINGDATEYERRNIPYEAVTSENVDDFLAELERIENLGIDGSNYTG